MPKPVAAIVLAGGRSTRLGRDKASEPLLGVPLLQRVLDRLAGLTTETVVVGRPEQDFGWARATHLRAIEDSYPGAGPLGAIYTGLNAVEAPIALVLACDMPLLQPGLLAALVRLAEEHEAVVPVCEGLAQPLCAAYRRTCAAALRTQIETGNLKVAAVVARLLPRYVYEAEWRRWDPEGLSFHNLNSEADLRRAEALLAVSPAPGS